jgi:cholesterol transport system auxiliary component
MLTAINHSTSYSDSRSVYSIWWVLFGFAVLLQACTSLPGNQSKAAVKIYLLEFPNHTELAQSAVGASRLTLRVSQPRGAPGYDTSRMAYVQESHRLDYFTHNKWVDTPAHMLRPIITQTLERSGLFHVVLETPAPVAAQLHLDTEILHLRQVFKGGGSIVQLSLRLVLVDQINRRVLATQVLSFSEPAPENTPYGGVVAANRTIARLLPVLIEFMRVQLAMSDLTCEGCEYEYSK